MRVLGIETSCDETAVAVVDDGEKVLASLIAGQAALHGRFGGVVPELASRAHLETINPLLDAALAEAQTDLHELDGVAVTVGPGLVGALLVGMATAKAVALALDLPFIGVNHLEGHIYANVLEHGHPDHPYVAFIVSGGHTMLVHVPEEHRYELLGQTLARFVGLPFPGGPEIDRLAQRGNPAAIAFPRALAGSGDFDFSLSGLKTAVVRHVRAERDAGREVDLADLAASFQEAVVDVQVDKTMGAAEERKVSTVLLAGGVVANTRLRERMAEAAEANGLALRYPSPELCTDNAAMIACAGFFRLAKGERTSLEVGADAGLPLA